MNEPHQLPEDHFHDGAVTPKAEIESWNCVSLEQQDGGLRGWMSVAGSWFVLFTAMGNLYSFGVYEDYYTRIFLAGRDPSSISWMGSFQLASSFAMGPLSGRLFDAGYGRIIMIVGSLLFLFSTFMLSLAKEGQYYQVFLSQGLGVGLGAGFLFTPSSAIIGVYFKQRRSLALGITLSGISIGALLFPIVLNQLIPRIGFASTVRVTGYISLGCLVVGNMLLRPPRGSVNQHPVDILSFFRDPAYIWLLFASFVALLNLYFPAVYIQMYAISHNIEDSLSFYSIAILNGVGILGRLGGSWLADRYGIWNMQILVTVGTTASIWGMIGIHNPATLIAFSCIYGIFSGAWLSVGVSCLVSFASTPQEVGARVGVAYALLSIALLVSEPIQGALLTSEFRWIRPVVFSGTLMCVSVISYVVVRAIISRRKNSQRI
ncbi:hypothetical protein Ac2012v2_008175 [Leucoagaricus gongylophorus]